MTAVTPDAPDAPGTVRTVPLEMLTDEELTLLTSGPGVVVTPYLATVPEAERDVVRRTAFRGLLARGLVDAPDPGAEVRETGGDVTAEVLVRDDVRSAMTLRQAARTVIAVSRTGAHTQDFWYAHLVAEVVLLEEVAGDGIHRFALARSVDLPALLVAAAMAPGSADGAGEPVHLDTEAGAEPPPALLEHLGEAYLRADVVTVSAGPEGTDASPRTQPVLTGVWSGPRGSWSVVADPATASVSARPRRVEELEELLRAVARDALDEDGRSS